MLWLLFLPMACCFASKDLDSQDFCPVTRGKTRVIKKMTDPEKEIAKQRYQDVKSRYDHCYEILDRLSKKKGKKIKKRESAQKLQTKEKSQIEKEKEFSRKDSFLGEEEESLSLNLTEKGKF